jgi:ABC-2 type transport system permease protein
MGSGCPGEKSSVGLNELFSYWRLLTMSKTLFVMRHEVVTTLRRKSFLFVAFGLPIISALVFAGITAVNRKAPGVVSSILGPDTGSGGSAQSKPEGYVDESGLIRAIPSSVPKNALQAFPEEAAAKRALSAGEIRAYYLIPSNYLVTGEVVYVRPDFNPLSAFNQAGLIQWVLQVNLLGGDVQWANRVLSPLNLDVTKLQPASTRDQNNPLTFFIPYAVTFLYYIIILMSASLLLNSVTKEKENRVIEILMSTITPRQMLTGKIIGLGLVGLIQAAIWVCTSFVLLRLSGRTFALPASFQLPGSFLVWSMVFFILGYAVYASLMAAVGAMVPNLREASQATFIVNLPLLVPMMLISVLIQEPNGLLAVALSLFPLTAPVAMMTRLAASNVPLWQILLSAALLAITAVLIIRAVAGMFKAQTLLSGQPFDLKLLFSTLSKPPKEI